MPKIAQLKAEKREAAEREAAEQEFRKQHEAEAEAARRRRRRVGIAVLVFGILPAFVLLALLAFIQRNHAREASDRATSLVLAFDADKQLRNDFGVSLLLGLAAYEARPTAGAESSLISAFKAARGSGVTAILHGVRGPVAFSPDGLTLATVGSDGTVRLWNVKEHAQLGLVRPPGTLVKGVAFSPDGKTLATTHNDPTVRLWDVRRQSKLDDLVGPKGGSFSGVAFSPDGSTLAAVGSDGTVWLWNVKDPTRRGPSPGRLKGRHPLGRRVQPGREHARRRRQ